ncbi:BTAD domain-containing putative transcriptional regulator [Streptomyces sp. RerS4]|uniref:AfsR/SARP family transcriptional regulator n=1 Tax=Streptomyces sp. RerS4 TaxID=2942449 RepID=UPI00201BBF0B|nr:BTAD domain-containing putative transcriptional regulator [Streptomyces sp. RerS4]UQX05414.1 winged helix-turn-helix domain-containing protein [Streptomyces sp. RerS4]
MRFGVLGQLAVWTSEGTPVRVPELKVRTLLASLLVDAGRPVATHRLIDDLWGEEPPGNPTRALQAKVSQLRRALDEAEPGARDLVESQAPGYVLRAPDGALDSAAFTALAARARAAAEPAVRASLFADALAVWRGPAFADFEEDPFTRAAANRLEEERLVVREEHAEARLALGEHAQLVGELAELVARHPLRERLRAAHLRALYRAGRQSEALAGYEDLRARLAEDLGLDPSPALTALQRAILTQDPELAAPRPDATPSVPAPRTVPVSPTPAAPRTNLPAALSPLLGRDQAVAAVRELVAGRRLVTLTGPGGVGKTRLAIETAAGLDPDAFRDGIWLVELAGVGANPARRPEADEAAPPGRAAPTGVAPPGSRTTEVAEAVAGALGIRDDAVWGLVPAEQRRLTAGQRLAATLRDRELLLVLDNCEHLVDEVAELAELLLRTAPGLRILTTSQEALALAGETLWTVPTLELQAAVELFTARAAATAPGFALQADNRESVEAICARLDGIPLALELAATRVRALGVRGVLDRLDDRFRLLSSGRRGAPARQQTLRAVIDWSWELLGAPERAVLRRLAVHAEGCTLEAAEEVCAGEDIDPADVLDLLARLVDRSLLALTPTPAGPRYRLLESVAAYCAERLTEAGEERPVRARHLAHHLALAERAAPALLAAGQRDWLERLDTEAANLRAALAHALTLAGGVDGAGTVDGVNGVNAVNGPGSATPAGANALNGVNRVDGVNAVKAGTAQDGPADAALRLVRALSWYWVLRGRLGEGRRFLEAALAAPGEATPALRARVEVLRTGFAIMAGEGADRADRIRRSLRPYEDQRIGTAHDLAHARWFLGHALCGTGDLTSGRDLTERSLEGFAAARDDWGTAAALADRSAQRLLAGDLDGAARDGTRSAALFAELGDGAARLWSVYPLAMLAEIHGDYPEATRLRREGLDSAEHLGLTTQAADLLSGLGRGALLTGDLDAARDLHERSRRLAAEQGFQAGEINAVLGLGLGARRAGDLDEAEAHMRRVLDWHRSVGLDGANALVLAELGYAAELRGDAEAALALQEEGLAMARTTGDPRALALALEGLSGAHALAGRHTTAAALLGAADAARRSAGAPLPPAERADVDRITTAAHTALGPTAFKEAYDRGAGLPAPTAYSDLVTRSRTTGWPSRC